MATHPKLIITADDYGMSPLFNQGIEELAKLGLITGISIMIKRPFIDPERLTFPHVSLGLHLELEEVSSLNEITTQIKSFHQKFKKSPSYIDGHKHQHLSGHNFPLVAQAARSFRLPVRSRFPTDRSLLTQQGIATNHNFISWHPTRIPSLCEKIAEAKRLGVSELVVHPGYFDPTCSYPYNEQRENELAFLKSPRFKELIASFELATYSAAN